MRNLPKLVLDGESMAVQVILYSFFRLKYKGYDQENGIKIDIKEEMPIRDLLFTLKINADDSPMVSINGKLVRKNCMLKDNDVVEIFPVIYGG